MNEQEVNEVLKSARATGEISTQEECCELCMAINYLQNKYNNYEQEAIKKGDMWWGVTKLGILSEIIEAEYIVLKFKNSGK